MAGRVRSMKNSIDTVGNRTSDLSVCSAVPYATIVRSHKLVFVYNEVYFNPLNALLNPICKSQLAEFFCGVYKFGARFSIIVCIQI